MQYDDVAERGEVASSLKRCVLPWKTLNKKQRFMMYKTEESNLLELQDLALKHKNSKRQKTLEEKQKYQSTKVPNGFFLVAFNGVTNWKLNYYIIYYNIYYNI